LSGESPGSIALLGNRGVVAARLGDRTAATQFSEELASIDRPYTFGGPTVWRARIAALLGESSQAVSLLRQAYEEGAAFGVWLLHDMDLESLRNFAPFQEFIRSKG
jgi:hypothetical protein